MIKLLPRKTILLLAMLTMGATSFSYGDNSNIPTVSKTVTAPVKTSLTVKPNKCIVLHQGQMCYQRLRFSWAVADNNAYCLFNQTRNEVITCWHDKQLRQFKYRFKSSQSEVFQIRHRDQSKALAEVKVAVASVYRSKRSSSSGWRLF